MCSIVCDFKFYKVNIETVCFASASLQAANPPNTPCVPCITTYHIYPALPHNGGRPLHIYPVLPHNGGRPLHIYPVLPHTIYTLHYHIMVTTMVFSWVGAHHEAGLWTLLSSERLEDCSTKPQPLKPIQFGGKCPKF